MSRKQTQRRRGVFNVVIKAPLQGVRIDPSVHAFTAQRAPSVPPGPTNQSTFLINCIQIGRRLLERASEKTCFPARLSSARCYFCRGTKAYYPHTTCALSKEKTPTTWSQIFAFVFLRPYIQENTHFPFKKEPFGVLRG